MRELYVKTCTVCGKIFRTNNIRKRVCPDCTEYKAKITQKNYIMRKKLKKKGQNTGLSINEVMRIAKIYSAVKTYIQYGKMSNIIERSRSDRCVCCGATIPEGRIVCPTCERKAEEAEQKWKTEW